MQQQQQQLCLMQNQRKIDWLVFSVSWLFIAVVVVVVVADKANYKHTENTVAKSNFFFEKKWNTTMKTHQGHNKINRFLTKYFCSMLNFNWFGICEN